MEVEENNKENNQDNRISKFRFLIPEEKNKLREVENSNSGTNKNISFESNVDLTSEFEKKGYDTQRYNIKKIIQSRIDETKIFDENKYQELDERQKNIRLKRIQEKLKKNEKEPVRRVILSEDLVVDALGENTDENTNDNISSLIFVEKLGEESDDNQDLDQEANNEIVIKELEKILKNNSIQEQEREDLEEKERAEIRENFVIIKNDDNKPEKQKSQLSEQERRLEREREKKLQAQRFFDENEEVVEEVESEDTFKLTEFLSKYWAKILIGILTILIVIFSMNIITNEIEKRVNEKRIEAEENNAQTDEVGLEQAEATETELEVSPNGQEVELEVVDKNLENPIIGNETSGYMATIEIVSANVSSVVLEITNNKFRYVEDNNYTEYFNNYVYANIKNAEPNRDKDKYISLFGKNDNAHFGNLKYLTDPDFFKSISVDYSRNNSTTTYSAISYYQTEVLDERVYGKMSDTELLKFVTDEIAKSQHKVDVDIKNNSKILTLITFDEEINMYNVLHMINVN